jgi:phage terminase large subunit-like protein
VRAGPKGAPPGLPLDLGSLPESGGDRVIAFIHAYCKLPKGAKGNPAGRPIRLRAWQQEIVHGLFDDPRPRQALISVARKNGKTLLCAAVALYALLADAEESAEVIVVSVNEGTAKVCFDLARRMIELDDRLSGIVQVFQNRIYHPASDSVMEFLPGSCRLLQGRNPSLSVCDEIHILDSDIWDSMSLAGGTRTHPLTLGVSTQSGPENPDDLMGRLTAYGRAGGDPAFFYREYSAPDGCDLDDREAWRMANPMLNDTLAEEHLAALVKTTREPAFRRYHLNQAVSLTGRWLPAGAWAACQVPFAIPNDVPVVVAFDGSYNNDATALIACTVDAERPHLEVAGYWEPANGQPVDILAVEDAIRAACKRWQVLEVCADAYRWARSLEILDREGIAVVEYPQTGARMGPATAKFFEAVATQTISHDGDRRLANHLANAVLKQDARGARLAKPGNKHSLRRIDLAVCSVMAYDRACYYAESSGLSLYAFDLE